MSDGAAITGVGLSAVGRRLDREPTDLAIEACRGAIDSAGLSISDIDGVAAFIPDAGSAAIADVQDALGLELEWFAGSIEGPSQLEAILNARAAVSTGRARHVLAFHASSEGTMRGRGGSLPGTAREMPTRGTGPYAWWLPFGAPSAVTIFALHAQRYFQEYGGTREQLAQIALVQRANAGRNPAAVYREPLTLDDYLSARMISEPLCILDCDVPVDFGAAVVVSRADATSGLRHAPISITAGTARHSRPAWDQGTELATLPAMHEAAVSMWARTDLEPSDVRVAGLYDGFSYSTLVWLEALGFCGRGEGLDFLGDGSPISIDGQLPINTGGGQLSAGRMHGWGMIPEVCRQLWGECGDRQVANDPRVGAIGAGSGVSGAAILLTRD